MGEVVGNFHSGLATPGKVEEGKTVEEEIQATQAPGVGDTTGLLAISMVRPRSSGLHTRWGICTALWRSSRRCCRY